MVDRLLDKPTAIAALLALGAPPPPLPQLPGADGSTTKQQVLDHLTTQLRDNYKHDLCYATVDEFVTAVDLVYDDDER